MLSCNGVATYGTVLWCNAPDGIKEEFVNSFARVANIDMMSDGLHLGKADVLQARWATACRLQLHPNGNASGEEADTVGVACLVHVGILQADATKGLDTMNKVAFYVFLRGLHRLRRRSL